MDLGSIFSTHAEQEVIDGDGDAFLYIQTWYIDHLRYAECRRPRPLRLDQCSVAWIDEFRYLWRDVMDRSVFFSVHVVNPRPPQYRHYQYACQIVIEKNRPRGRVAGVLTALLSGHTNDGIVQGAFSLPTHVRHDDLIETLMVQAFCEGRPCTSYYNQEPVHVCLQQNSLLVLASACTLILLEDSI